MKGDKEGLAMVDFIEIHIYNVYTLSSACSHCEILCGLQALLTVCRGSVAAQLQEGLLAQQGAASLVC